MSPMNGMLGDIVLVRYAASSFRSLSLSSSSDSFSDDSTALRLPSTDANFEIMSVDRKSLAHDILWFSYSSYNLSTTLLLDFLMKLADFSMRSSFDSAIVSSFSFQFATYMWWAFSYAAVFRLLPHLLLRIQIIRSPIPCHLLRWPSICYAVFSEWCKCKGE